MTDLQRAYVPAKRLPTEYPLIDSDPHFKRVVRYARPSDYAAGAATAVFGPGLMLLWEKIAPSHVGRGGFAPIMRLSSLIGATAGFIYFYNRSICGISPFTVLGNAALISSWAVRFYGFEENKREVEMDMREMVDKVKKGQRLYGTTNMTPYMQGVASRNSRYAGVWLHVLPWFNFVNHEQHGVDTAKYYQQAERELEAERTGS